MHIACSPEDPKVGCFLRTKTICVPRTPNMRWPLPKTEVEVWRRGVSSANCSKHVNTFSHCKSGTNRCDLLRTQFSGERAIAQLIVYRGIIASSSPFFTYNIMEAFGLTFCPARSSPCQTQRVDRRRIQSPSKRACGYSPLPKRIHRIS